MSSKHRRQGDLIHQPGNLADQITQDRSVGNKKNRQKQKRKYDDEEEEHVSSLNPKEARTCLIDGRMI